MWFLFVVVHLRTSDRYDEQRRISEWYDQVNEPA